MTAIGHNRFRGERCATRLNRHGKGGVEAGMAKSEKAVQIKIYDQEYTMRGNLDATYIQGLARFVDAKMRSVADRSKVVDSLQVAVLAALNIADEFNQLKALHESQTRRIQEKANEYNRALDQVLKAAG